MGLNGDLTGGVLWLHYHPKFMLSMGDIDMKTRISALKKAKQFVRVRANLHIDFDKTKAVFKG
jgi:hypothetical protein